MARKIVICCDGTGNKFCKNNTNVVRLFQAIEKDDDQIVFYDPGVGTFTDKLLQAWPLSCVGALWGAAFGTGLQANVEDAYAWLMDNYIEGDQIFLFGFSRGAHTVRRLASMIDACGLMFAGKKNLIEYASEMYVDMFLKKGDREIVQKFKETFSRECSVHFVGVWDTVSALPRAKLRPKLDGVLHKGIRNAFHAISIDEARIKFPASLWNEENIDTSMQTVQQVWFSGVHSDVGGFYDERGLSDTALKWMLENAMSKGLRVKKNFLSEISPDHLDQQHESRVGFWKIFPYKNRVIPAGSKIHKSVQMRIQAGPLPKDKNRIYNPKMLEKIKDRIEWVD